MKTLSSSGSPYEMSRTDPVCAASGRALAEGEPCIAVLVAGQDGEPLQKLVYNPDAWSDLASPDRPSGLFAFWRTRAGASGKGDEAEKLLRLEELEDLFEQLEGTEDEERQALRYLLALVLSRRRVLLYEGGVPGIPARGDEPARPGEMVFKRKVRAGEETPVYRVIDPGLSEERASALGEQLASVLGAEFDR